MGLSTIIALPSGSRDDLAGTPTIPEGTFAGDCVLLFNRGSAELTLQSESSLPGSKLNLKAATVTLQPYDGLQLTWDGTEWYETGRSFAPDIAMNAADYGLRESNTGAQNNTAMALALAAAQSAGKELHLPEGTFKFNVHGLSHGLSGGVAAAIIFTASTTVRGAGQDKTVLVADGWVEPTYSDPQTIAVQNDNGTALMFTGNVSGINVKLFDLSIRGPAAADLTHLLSNIWGIYDAGGGSLHTERVGFTLFNQSLKFSPNYPSYPGTGTAYTAVDCTNRFRGGGILHIGFNGSAASNVQLLCTYDYHHELTDLVSQLPSASEARHCLYIGNGVSLRTTLCTFLSSGGSGGEGGFAWRHYSVGDPDVPLYSESIGDYISSGCASAYATNPNFVTTIIGATVMTAAGNFAVDVTGPSKFSGCHFVGATGAGNAIQDGTFSSGQATIQDCLFEGDWEYAVYRVLGVADRWKVGPNVEFRHSASTGGAGIRVRAGGMDIDGVVFNVQGAGTGASIFLTGGDVRMGNSRFAAGCKYSVVSPSDAAVTLDLRPGNQWDDSGSMPLVTPDGVRAITFKGEAAFYESVAGLGDGFQISGAPGATLSGSLRCGQGVGSYSYASNVLTIGWNKNAYPINEGGTPTIKTIAMKGVSASGAAAADHIKAGAPRAVLLAQQAFALDNTGNIVLASSPLAVAANTAVELQWFPALAKWYVI
jgi:hypothetical protein